MQFTTSDIATKIWEKMLSDPPASVSLLLVSVLLLANFLGSMKVIVSVAGGGLACYAWLSTMQDNAGEAHTMTDDATPTRPASKFAAARPVRRRLDKASTRKESSVKKRSANECDVDVPVSKPAVVASTPEYNSFNKVDDSIIHVKHVVPLVKNDDKIANVGDSCLKKAAQDTSTPMEKLLQFVTRDHKSHQGKWTQTSPYGAAINNDLDKMREQVKAQQSMVDVLLEFKDPDVIRLISELRPRIAALQDKINAMTSINQDAAVTPAVIKTKMSSTAKPFQPQVPATNLFQSQPIHNASRVLEPTVSREEKILRGWAMGGSGRTTPFTPYLSMKTGNQSLDEDAYGANNGFVEPPPGLEPDAWMVASSPIHA